MDELESNTLSSPPLNQSDILIAEFEYVAETAFQANEDRARVSQFFIITFGTLLVAILSVQIESVNIGQIYIAFSVIFSFVGILGILTILYLVRLRKAWLDSVLAMNNIKKFFIDQNKTIAGVFIWSSNTIPPAFKPMSIGFIVAIEIAILSGLSIGVSYTFFQLTRTPDAVAWMPSIAIGVLSSIMIFIVFYWLPLAKDHT